MFRIDGEARQDNLRILCLDSYCSKERPRVFGAMPFNAEPSIDVVPPERQTND